MDREEIVRLLVLNAISDDYENIDQCVLSDVGHWAVKLGLRIERAEIVAALTWLVENGMAKAYDLLARDPHTQAIDGMPSVTAVEYDFRTYFYITEKGMDLHLAPNPILDKIHDDD
jgi:hypothetical protein